LQVLQLGVARNAGSVTTRRRTTPELLCPGPPWSDDALVARPECELCELSARRRRGCRVEL